MGKGSESRLPLVLSQWEIGVGLLPSSRLSSLPPDWPKMKFAGFPTYFFHFEGTQHVDKSAERKVFLAFGLIADHTLRYYEEGFRSRGRQKILPHL